MRAVRLVSAMCLLVALVSMPGGTIQAQTGYPQRNDLYVNDYADVIPANEEAGLRRHLQELNARRGIEGSVLTVRSVQAYAAGDSIETFSTHVFNRWGIDNAETNDGFLIVLAVADRDVRIELGRAYGHRYDSAMQEVIDAAMLPWFREENYSRGLLEGTDATVEALTSAGGFFDRIFDVRWLAIPIVVASAAMAVWRRVAYYLSGGCLLELPGLVGAAVVGAVAGGLVGAIWGMVGFDVNQAEASLYQVISLFESGRFAREFSLFNLYTVSGAGIGALVGAVLRLFNPSSQRYRHQYGSDSDGGGGSADGGGASGSW